jgi:hypothetical protein
MVVGRYNEPVGVANAEKHCAQDGQVGRADWVGLRLHPSSERFGVRLCRIAAIRQRLRLKRSRTTACQKGWPKA